MPKLDDNTALVVGAGGFGKYYARILSELGYNVVLSRTSKSAAEKQVTALHRERRSSDDKIIGVRILTVGDLANTLVDYNPGFVAVTAKSRNPMLGDKVHPEIAGPALAYGCKVLCEKPFDVATGDGESLDFFLETSGFSGYLDNLSLELPFKQLYEALRQNGGNGLYDKMYHAQKMSFLWRTTGSGNDVVGDLLLHPLSFIPDDFVLEEVKGVADIGNEAKVDIVYSHDKRKIDVSVSLGYERDKKAGNTAAFQVDDQVVGVVMGANLENMLVPTDVTLDDIALARMRIITGEPIVSVVNPLKLNIQDALAGKGLVSGLQVRDYQAVIEMVRAYGKREG